jgi:hypothetical protein
MPPSSYSAGRFLLNLDGTLVSPPSLGGGSIKGEVVTYRTGSGTVPVSGSPASSTSRSRSASG